MQVFGFHKLSWLDCWTLVVLGWHRLKTNKYKWLHNTNKINTSCMYSVFRGNHIFASCLKNTWAQYMQGTMGSMGHLRGIPSNTKPKWILHPLTPFFPYSKIFQTYTKPPLFPHILFRTRIFWKINWKWFPNFLNQFLKQKLTPRLPLSLVPPLTPTTPLFWHSPNGGCESDLFEACDRTKRETS